MVSFSSFIFGLLIPLLVGSISNSLAAPTATPNKAVAKRSSSPPVWADINTATIKPGVRTSTGGSSCTSNFVFYNEAGDVFIGQAAHCAGTGTEDQSNGCSSPTLGEGIPVRINGANFNGTLAYSSWVRMQSANEQDQDACAYNDFALVKLDKRDVINVNPTIPKFNGPDGIRTTNVGTLEPLYAFGNSVLRKDISVFKPKYGVQLREQGNRWSHVIYGHFGIPGDSGCLTIDGNGYAVGTLSTYDLVPLPLTNSFTDLARALDYMRAIPEFSDIKLAYGTKPYNFALPIPK